MRPLPLSALEYPQSAGGMGPTLAPPTSDRASAPGSARLEHFLQLECPGRFFAPGLFGGLWSRPPWRSSRAGPYGRPKTGKSAPSGPDVILFYAFPGRRRRLPHPPRFGSPSSSMDSSSSMARNSAIWVGSSSRQTRIATAAATTGSGILVKEIEDGIRVPQEFPQDLVGKILIHFLRGRFFFVGHDILGLD